MASVDVCSMVKISSTTYFVSTLLRESPILRMKSSHVIAVELSALNAVLHNLWKGMRATSKGLHNLSKGLNNIFKGLNNPSKGLSNPSKFNGNRDSSSGVNYPEQ